MIVRLALGEGLKAMGGEKRRRRLWLAVGELHQVSRVSWRGVEMEWWWGIRRARLEGGKLEGQVELEESEVGEYGI